MTKFNITVAADVRGYATLELDCADREEAIQTAAKIMRDHADCPMLYDFNFRDGAIKGDVSILAAQEGQEGDEWHDVPEWDGMPRYNALLAERDRLKAYVESMARMTTPEDEFADPEHTASKQYADADKYRFDFSDDRLFGEFDAFMAMVEDARKLLNGEPTVDSY